MAWHDFVQVGQPLDRIGQGLLVDLGVLGPDAVADGAVIDWQRLGGS